MFPPKANKICCNWWSLVGPFVITGSVKPWSDPPSQPKKEPHKMLRSSKRSSKSQNGCFFFVVFSWYHFSFLKKRSCPAPPFKLEPWGPRPAPSVAGSNSLWQQMSFACLKLLGKLEKPIFFASCSHLSLFTNIWWKMIAFLTWNANKPLRALSKRNTKAKAIQMTSSTVLVISNVSVKKIKQVRKIGVQITGKLTKVVWTVI